MSTREASPAPPPVSRCLSTLSGYLPRRYYTGVRALAARGVLRATPLSVNRALRRALPVKRAEFTSNFTAEVKVPRRING